jgi:lipid-A-disaccharide synthase
MKQAKSKSIVIVAGEASGDLHGARVVLEIKKQMGDIFICGVGGPALAKAGVQIIFENNRLAVVGITEALSKFPIILKTLGRLKKLLRNIEPDLLILIDFPDFNLHLAGYAKKLGIPVLYYISPQIWAWRPGRVKKIKARVDHMAVILPFEKDFYEKHGVPVTFVGHPLLDVYQSVTTFQKKIHNATPIVGLLPGSRDREVNRLLPLMLKAAAMLQKKLGAIRFVVSCAPTIDREMLHSLADSFQISEMEIIREPVNKLLARADLILAASGTVTLEAAIHAVPMIILYTISPMSFWLAKRLVKVDHIGLANLIANKRIVPELVQAQVTPERIAEEAFALLSNPQAYLNMRKALTAIRNQLGSVGASRQVAQIALKLMEHSSDAV